MAKQNNVSTPFWRDNRIIPILLQILFVIIVLVTGGFLINNALNGLARQGMEVGFGFLNGTASFNITEALIDYQPTDTYKRAVLVGILNTIKVSVIGVIFATLIGVFVGISRLSTNWLVQKIAGLYIEIFRNTPLLVQIFIWYFAVFLQLPQVKESITIGSFHLSNRGASIPWFEANSGTVIWIILFLLGIVLAFTLWRKMLKSQITSGKRKYPFVWAIGSLVASLVIAFIITQQGPANITVPVLGNFNFEGGHTLTPEFLAILIGLTVYTATYIAEIVRGGILSVSKGQVEAAKALGVKSSTIMRLVIFPQAIRIIIPPVTSQYLNLTKNSSLAIAVGYADLVFVGNTTLNQTGRAVEMVLIMILVYLTLSLLTSWFMNYFNKKTQIVER
ncbi:ABC transporter permease subunit [Aquibacillus halophilus]|uniref:ABC transporter permease subunit n=1 Tax=Aquibacillus halophilus TaxID=930132 RepID=A0A6A8D970_9BACI|nr:ABC transporter permease subunit [Aquibacillus halophilus]MRH41810.1 ABC transporter permease subunit [Aquibacillus halophilus]